MMNFVTLCLVVSSLAAAGVWSPSPNPEDQNKKEQVIVKDGHRVVVVEYDDEGNHKTKVSISPAEDGHHHKPASPAPDVEEKLSSAASDVLNNVKDRASSSMLPHFGRPGSSKHDDTGAGPGELICDAYGKCKHKIASAIEKAKVFKFPGAGHDIASAKKESLHEGKDVVSGLAHKGFEVKKEMAYEAKDIVEDAVGKAKEIASEKTRRAKEAASEKAHGVKEAAEDAIDKAKQAASEKARGAKEAAGDALGKAKETASEKVHGAKEAVEDALGKVKETLSDKAHGGKEAAEDALAKAKETAAKKAHEAEEAAKDALGKAEGTVSEKAYEAKEAAKDALGKAKETVSEKAYEAKENVKDARAIGTTIRGDVQSNVSEQVEKASPSVLEKAREAKQGTEHAVERADSGIRNLFVRIGVYLHGFFRFLGIPETLSALMVLTNLLGFSTAYGMSMWVTFISSYVLAGALPRQQFGMVQSKIYPVYFRAMACTIGVALLGHIPWLLSSSAGMFQGFNLMAAILMVFANSLYLEPRATKAMFERMKIEKEESEVGDTSRVTEAVQGTTTAPIENPEQEEARTKMTRLCERLKRLNTYSAALNAASLMSLTWHLVYLGQSLHTTCD